MFGSSGILRTTTAVSRFGQLVRPDVWATRASRPWPVNCRTGAVWHIVLIGLMGSGKTTVGTLVAQRLEAAHPRNELVDLVPGLAGALNRRG